MATSFTFTKMQGVGNDFVIVDGRAGGGQDWSGLAREICDRHFGIGADGLLVVDRSSVADVAMRMYNPDGTPDVCGNGLRCVARYVADRDARSPDAPAELTVATLAGARRAIVHLPDAAGHRMVTVDMGEPRFRPPEIPMEANGERVVDFPLEAGSQELRVTSLSTGTTHTVVFVDSLPDDELFLQLSPRIEHHKLFPERTSLMWAHVEAPGVLRLRIWERGAGETWGCGTGSCAAAVAYRLHGHGENPVRVLSKGGELSIDWEEGRPIRMTGPASYVFEGRYPLDPGGLAR